MEEGGVSLNRRQLIVAGAGAAVGAAVPIGHAHAEADLAKGGCPTARIVPPPGSISEGARAYLRRGATLKPPLLPPPIGDVQGWRKYIENGDKGLPVDMILGLPGIDLRTQRIGGVTCHVATPQKLAGTDARKVHLYIHGGGWILFGGRGTMALAKIAAMQFGSITCAVDYRMPPDHPFPAGLDDCLAVYRDLLARHGAGNILVSGSSAGGNLAAALMLKARDTGLKKPAALVLDTPATDLTNSGDSWTVLDGLDPVLRDPGGVGSAELYLHGADPRDPYLSPLFGKLAGAFPPTYLRTGTRDRLLSDTIRMHAALRAADVPADLYVAEAMPHGGFGGLTAEDNAALTDMRKWLMSHWPAT